MKPHQRERAEKRAEKAIHVDPSLPVYDRTRGRTTSSSERMRNFAALLKQKRKL